MNDSGRVGLVSEDLIDTVAETGIVNQVGDACAVLSNKRVDLSLGKADLKGSKASAELKRL